MKPNPAPKPKLGRRSKCTDDYVPKFLEHIESGQSISASAGLSGLSEPAVHAWLASARAGDTRYAEFLEGFTRARALAQQRAVDRIRKLGDEEKDWRAEAFLIERMHPKDFCL